MPCHHIFMQIKFAMYSDDSLIWTRLLPNRQSVQKRKLVPTLFVQISEISGLPEPGLTNHHCTWKQRQIKVYRTCAITVTISLLDLHIDASMLAVALWFSGNHNAANLVGANITNGCAHAVSVCPSTNTGYLLSMGTPSNVLTLRRNAPTPFNHAERSNYKARYDW